MAVEITMDEKVKASLHSEDICENEMERSSGNGLKRVCIDLCEPVLSPDETAMIDDPIEDIRLAWVDKPVSSNLKNWRCLVRYARELLMLSGVMKEYSRSNEKVDQKILDQTLEYSLKAHTVYSGALHDWLEENPFSFSRPMVQKLVKDYRGTEDLNRYHARASRDPEARSYCSSASQALSHISQSSAKIILEQQNEIDRLHQLNISKELEMEERAIEMEMKCKKRDLEIRKRDLQLKNFEKLTEDLEMAADAPAFNRAMSAMHHPHAVKGSAGGQVDVILKTPGGPIVEEDTFKLADERHQNLLAKESNLMESRAPTQHIGPVPVEQNRNAPCCSVENVGSTLATWKPSLSYAGDEGLHFSGQNEADYPAYRHRFELHYNEWRRSRPDLLLRWLESTVEGQAKRYIRNAYAITDPGKACDVIWYTLEEVYGQKYVILENASKQVRRAFKYIGHDRKLLLEWRADLRNLKGVAFSIKQEAALENRQLLGQLYNAFDDKLRIRFDSKYLSYHWTFDSFLEFLSFEISYVDWMSVVQVDLKVVPEHSTKRFTGTQRHGSGSRQTGSNRMAGAVDGVKQSFSQDQNKAEQCCLHPLGKEHPLRECRNFLDMNVSSRWKVATKHHPCFLCLKKHHYTQNCKRNFKCHLCDQLHHELLHGTIPKDTLRAHTKAKEVPSARLTTHNDTNAKPAQSGGCDVLGFLKLDHAPTEQIGLMELTAIAQDNEMNAEHRITFYAAIDTGATHSLCSRDLAKQLYGEWSFSEYRDYKMFNGTIMRSKIMTGRLRLEKVNGDIVDVKPIAFVDQALPFAQYLPDGGTLPKRIDMIFGSDLVWDYLLVDPQLQTQHKAVLQDLGTFWLGTLDEDKAGVCCASVCADAKTTCSRVRLTLKDSKYDQKQLESDPFYCSVNDNRVAMSINDEKVLEHYQNTIQEVRLSNGETHLQFTLPWARTPELMKDNYEQAKSALLGLRRKLENSPDLLTKYCEKIEGAIKEGHLVRLPEEVRRQEMQDMSKPRYYIPHFHTNQSKFRVVYDAAREYRGVSLNSLLERGPIFMQSLRSILLRFGEQKHAIAGDITNMFFQIRIAPEDRHMLRILWFEKPGMQGDIADYEFCVAPYGLRCIPSVAGYALLYTAEKNIPSVSENATARVTRDMFVDDLLTGVQSVEEGQQMIEEISKLLASTGFHLSKWCASDSEILQNVDEDNRAPALRDIRSREVGRDGNRIQKTLGLVWDTNADEMLMKVPEINPADIKHVTKRQVVSLNHQLFDPLGWWAPLYVNMNLCCSNIVRQISEWDDVVPPSLTKDWQKAIRCVDSIGSVPFIRRRVPAEVTTNSKFEYHVFTDSSKDVAAAAVYLRVETETECEVNLVAAKTSIFSQAELFRGSIPRKELIALDLGARLLRECLEGTTLPIDNFELWSDSKTVIQWCSQKSLELRVFERNRVDLILRNTQGKAPRYVATDLNPADVATRGCRAEQVKRWHLWTRGPAFLCQPNQDWREYIDDPETKHSSKKDAIVQAAAHPVKSDSSDIAFMQNVLGRTNELAKAITIISSLIKCVRKWKTQTFKQNKKQCGDTNSVDPRYARLAIVRVAQTACFGDVIHLMERGCTFQDSVKQLPSAKRKGWMHALKKFVPFLDSDRILRVGGRFDYMTDLTHEQKCPAFLPK